MKFDFSGLAKNKNMLIILVAIIIVCGGSLLGVKTMTSSFVEPTQIQTTTQAPTVQTTAPTTTEPTTTETTTTTTEPITETTTVPTTSDSLITTFQMEGTTAPTTVPTTVPTTETTTRADFTLPALQLPSTTASSGSNSNGLLSGLKPNGVLFDDGIASYQYNKTGNYYYTNEDPWQRALGYNELYDNGAAFVAIYIDTMRCKFRYDNKDWMIQFWKGQYGYIFIGHEIGVYYKPTNRTAEHYDCVSDEDSLYMEMNGMRDGEVLYHRDYGRY